jgi:hypothetical protein
MAKGFDYSFKDRALHYTVEEFNEHGTPPPIDRHGQYPIIGSPDKATRKKLEEELSKTTQTLVAKDKTGAIQIGKLNADAPKENGLMVYNMGIGGNMAHPVGLLELQHLAHAFPEQAILVTNNAGSGGSSLYPREVIKKLRHTGSFQASGEWTNSVLRPIFETFDNNLSVEGNSAGARLGLGMAAAMLDAIDEYNLQHVRVVDPPGAKNTNTLGVLANFVSQGPRANKYAQSPYNPYELGTLETADPANLFTAKGAFADNMWNLPSAMRRRYTFVKDIASALAAVQEGGDVTIIQPEHSEFATPDDMRTAMGHAARIAAARVFSTEEKTLRLIELSGHSHAIMSNKVGPNPIVTVHKIAQYESSRN